MHFQHCSGCELYALRVSFVFYGSLANRFLFATNILESFVDFYRKKVKNSYCRVCTVLQCPSSATWLICLVLINLPYSRMQYDYEIKQDSYCPILY